MDLRQLRYFVAVAEELSFTAAARRLHISQPPLSTQVQALERSLGVRLFERSSRQVVLTDAGRVLLDEARHTLSRLAGAVERAQRAERGEAGLLRVAFTGSVPLVPAFATLVAAFRREWPLARLQIEHMPTGAQLQALEERRIDVGLLRPSRQYRPPAHLKLTAFWKDELRLVVPQGHPAARRRRPAAVTLLAGQPLVLFPRGIGCGLHDHVMALCARAGFVPQGVHEAREGTTIVGLVAAGMGLSLLPSAYERLTTVGVHYAALEPALAASQVCAAHRVDEPHRLAEHFVHLAREAGRHAA
ncbi:LysR substrate-binding domain-containing protein [Pseudorhodoferax sp.]|uniref:LysR substrate-binding domain-containing protein n=1 Tax=Pseudorhodoferax sp. TaxID=1993553 RepID=UPI002DD68586|nr:LysR substrate-binding domain-containing protein [Pseudorhodoferax sp.]